MTRLSLNESAFIYYPRLRAVEQYVRAHPTDTITLDRIAQIAGLERKYFSAYFRSKVGATFTTWLRLTRVRRAKELIEAEDLPISRLGCLSGFRDIRTFERAFKEFLDVTPAAYRHSVRPCSPESPPKARLVPQSSGLSPHPPSEQGVQ